MFTIKFGHAGHTAQSSSLTAAVSIAQALNAQGWLAIVVTDPNGDRVNWLTA
jgi:hypothetical protein